MSWFAHSATARSLLQFFLGTFMTTPPCLESAYEIPQATKRLHMLPGPHVFITCVESQSLKLLRAVVVASVFAFGDATEHQPDLNLYCWMRTTTNTYIHLLTAAGKEGANHLAVGCVGSNLAHRTHNAFGPASAYCSSPEPCPSSPDPRAAPRCSAAAVRSPRAARPSPCSTPCLSPSLDPT